MSELQRVEFSYEVDSDVWIPLPTRWPDATFGTKQDWIEYASRICTAHTSWWNPIGRKQWRSIVSTAVRDRNDDGLDIDFLHVPGKRGRIIVATLSFSRSDIEESAGSREEHALKELPAPLAAPQTTPFLSPSIGEGIKLVSTHQHKNNGRNSPLRVINYVWEYNNVFAHVYAEHHDLARLDEFEPDLDELARSFRIHNP
ncbi:hypothetical protein ACX3O0_14110 [Homoserinimonas sp. A447]